MSPIPQDYPERVYAGWLGKIIGIRLGAPVESWTYDKIRTVYGELTHYPVDFHEFAADDDSNGPIFFLRALEDARQRRGDGRFTLSAQDVAEALLNYAPYEHGFFWWGGYGTSTEHTAYLNLRSGIPAPRSGSIAQNGATIAEQIGGQIFIDTWGLVAPGNPDLAARYARAAASVTHDGNGIYGGIFIACCVSLAFVLDDCEQIMEQALAYIPTECEYTRVVRAVQRFYHRHSQDWRACFAYLRDHFGYDKYPGNCHIIPNAGVVALALLYGENDFSRAITICNMCGWDTDCNTANVGAILGVLCGLDGIDAQKWRAPVHDFLACSSVVGSLNIMDIPYGTSYIAKLAYQIAGEKAPEPYQTIFNKRIASCHFEYPGSTHALCVQAAGKEHAETVIENSDAYAHSGRRSLKIYARPVTPGEQVLVYQRAYLRPDDFHDSRYDPAFSPTVYPGQTLHASVLVPPEGKACLASLYFREAHSGKITVSPALSLSPDGQWQTLHFTIPALTSGCIREIGVCLTQCGEMDQPDELLAFVDDLYADGAADYTIRFADEHTEIWPGLHREISQMTRLKGITYLEDGAIHLSCADFGENYTGHHAWGDYTVSAQLIPMTGSQMGLNFRVQGAMRSYALAFDQGKIALLKNDSGYRTLCDTAFAWQTGERYELRARLEGKQIMAWCNNQFLFTYQDEDFPYLCGAVGLSVRNGAHLACREIAVSPNRA